MEKSWPSERDCWAQPLDLRHRGITILWLLWLGGRSFWSIQQKLRSSFPINRNHAKPTWIPRAQYFHGRYQKFEYANYSGSKSCFSFRRPRNRQTYLDGIICISFYWFVVDPFVRCYTTLTLSGIDLLSIMPEKLSPVHASSPHFHRYNLRDSLV